MGPLRDYLFKVGCGCVDLASILGSDAVRSGAIVKRSPGNFRVALVNAPFKALA